MCNRRAERRRGKLTMFYNQVPLVSRCKPHPTSQQPLDRGRLAHPPQRTRCGHSVRGLQWGGRLPEGAESPAGCKVPPGDSSPDRRHYFRVGRENRQDLRFDLMTYLPCHSLGDTASELPTEVCGTGQPASNALPIPALE